MKWFWLMYGIVLFKILEDFDWAKTVASFYENLIKPGWIRGGVALAGLHAIWAVISSYLAS